MPDPTPEMIAAVQGCIWQAEYRGGPYPKGSTLWREAQAKVDALRSVLAHLEASRWRPIAEAPRDRPVLVWDKRTGECRAAELCTSIEEGDTAWVYARRFSWEGEPALAFVAHEPTHWMPLPSPPAPEGT